MCGKGPVRSGLTRRQKRGVSLRTQDILANQRTKVNRWVTIVALLIFAPFALNNLLQGRLTLGFGCMAVVGLLLSNTLATYRGRPAPFSMEWLFPVVAASLVMSFKTQGVIGAFWSYPALIFFYFLLPLKRARWANLLLLLILIPTAYSTLSPMLALRIAATLLAVSATSGIFIHLIATAQEELRQAAILDPLTQVNNRLQLDLVLHRSHARCRRYGNPVSLVSLDLDHFKNINDTLGHAAGDQVLRGVAKILKQRLRKSDVIFRTGGEEFLLVLEGSDEENSTLVAEELRDLFEGASILGERPVTASFGVAELSPEEEVPDWLKRADERLYRAKQAGRNRVVSTSIPQGYRAAR